MKKFLNGHCLGSDSGMSLTYFIELVRFRIEIIFFNLLFQWYEISKIILDPHVIVNVLLKNCLD